LESTRAIMREMDTEKPPSEIMRLKQILSEPSKLIDHIGDIEMLVRRSAEKVNIRALPQFQLPVKEAFKYTMRRMPEKIETMIHLFGSANEGQAPWVNFDDVIQEGLLHHIEDGNLQQAINITNILEECHKTGFVGRSYRNALESLAGYNDALVMGTQSAESGNDQNKMELYRKYNRLNVLRAFDLPADTDINAMDTMPPLASSG